MGPSAPDSPVALTGALDEVDLTGLLWVPVLELVSVCVTASLGRYVLTGAGGATSVETAWTERTGVLFRTASSRRGARRTSRARAGVPARARARATIRARG
jgi:hypothetical protein